MANNRIFFGIYQAALKADADAGTPTVVHGLQNCGMSTNYNLDQLFEIGQVSLYALIEDLPDVQLTMSKVLDGYPLIYHRATITAPLPTLIGRSTVKCIAVLSIFPDTNSYATGTPGSEVTVSGLFCNSVAYSFPVDGFATEEVTLVGNNKVWARDPNIALGAPAPSVAGQFTGTDAPIGQGGASRRNSIQFDPVNTGVSGSALGGDTNGQYADYDVTILPPQVHGITTSGLNPLLAGTTTRACHIQSINISSSLNRESLNELGHLAPYTRSVTLPIEVTTDITVISISGDMVSATEFGIYSTGTACGQYRGNLVNSTIRVASCEGTRVYCGLKNKLANIGYNGGGADGSNLTVTYSFTNFNDLTVMHSGDPNANFSWANRNTYLVN